MTGRGLWLNLCWIWLVVLIVYLVWGGLTQSGLYYWVGTLQVDRFGSYDAMLTGIAPGLLLGVPALWPLGMEARRQRRAPPDPAASARAMRRAGFLTGGLGFAALAGAVTCFLMAPGLPGGGGRPVPFDAAALGNGPPPAGMVSLTGTPDEAARASVTGGGKNSSWTTSYTGFRTAGEAGKDGPLRIFVERRVDNRTGSEHPYVGNEVSGIVLENGLPPLILYALDRHGVRVASPHYLVTSSSTLRMPYFTGAALGTILGCVLIAVAALLLLLPSRGPRVPSRPGQ
jgi:hypothetical protein